MDDRLYFRQLLSGYDFAVNDPVAAQMVNFVYMIGDRESRTCLLVDPAYAVDELLDIARADDMEVEGVLATHYHPDHVGGSMMGMRIEGISRLLESCSIPVHVNAAELPWVERTTGVSSDHLVAHDAGDVVSVGSIDVTLVHTPGHTPGSQCFLVDGRLVSGDTLFLDGCGRTDLPGSDPSQMYDSLTTLAAMPDDTVIYPGHRYSQPACESLGSVRNHNFVLKPMNKEQWLTIFG